MFQLLLKANTASALVTDPQGRYLLHYACRHLGNITCAVNIIKMLLIAHKEATMGLDSDECYAITTAGNKYLLLSTLLIFFSSSLLLFFSSSLLLSSLTFLKPFLYLSFTSFLSFRTFSRLSFTLPQSYFALILFTNLWIILLTFSFLAQFSTVEVVKLLHTAYPAATLIDHENYKRNVIHNGIYNNTDPAMVRYLCTTFPEALQGFSQDRYVCKGILRILLQINYLWRLVVFVF